MVTTLNSSWVTTSPSHTKCQVKLFCFPYAGGGSAVFFPWRDIIRPEIELLRVQLPGREHRLREPLFINLEALVDKLADELVHYCGQQPVAFFGHSMGALMAFELARELRRRHNILPVHLFVSGYRAPHLQNPDSPCTDLPDTDFIERLCQYEGIPDLILYNDELLELFLPILRADFKILETYSYKEGLPLDCPLTAFGGISDPKVSNEDIDAWEIHASMHFNSLFLSGGHFFIHDSLSEVLDQINFVLGSSNS